MTKEATARIKIKKLLEAAGWRFFADGYDAANIRLEPSVTIKSTDLAALGENFEKIERGSVDFLLLDAKGFPLLVLEAKAEAKNPLVGKEQARKYARSQNYDSIRELHDVLCTKYGSDDASVAANSAALLPSRDNAKPENHASHGGIAMLGSEAASVVMPPHNR